MLAGRISGGNAMTLAKQIWDARWTRAEQWLLSAVDAARSQRCDRLLLSSEWLLGALANEGRLLELSRRLSRLGSHPTELLLILRDPVEQLISHYKHRAKSGQAGSLDAWVDSNYLLPGRLAAIRKQIEDSGATLVVRGYGKQPGALERLFFEDWLAIPVPAEASGLRVNPSLSLSELVLLRKLRALQPGLVPYLYERLLAVDPDVQVSGVQMQDYARRVAANAVARHAEEWQRWNAMLPESERFSIPQLGPEPGPEPDSLELSASQMSAVIQLLVEAATPGFMLRLYWSWRLRPALSRIKRSIRPWRARR